MKYLLLLACLILCFCSSEKEEFENSPLPNFNSSVEPDPSILECPPEDIAEYPVSEPIQLPEYDRSIGFCLTPLKVSVKELSFSAKGGVRCVTTSEFSYPKGDINMGCRTEFEIVSDTVNDPPHFIGVNKFKKDVCPWLIAMKADERVIYISVDKNETGNERKMVMSVERGNCHGGFTITQSAE